MDRSELAPGDLILLFREEEDLESHDPDMGGVVKLISETKSGHWGILYRLSPQGRLEEASINLDGFAEETLYSGSDSMIGKKK